MKPARVCLDWAGVTESVNAQSRCHAASSPSQRPHSRIVGRRAVPRKRVQACSAMDSKTGPLYASNSRMMYVFQTCNDSKIVRQACLLCDLVAFGGTSADRDKHCRVFRNIAQPMHPGPDVPSSAGPRRTWPVTQASPTRPCVTLLRRELRSEASRKHELRGTSLQFRRRFRSLPHALR